MSTDDEGDEDMERDSEVQGAQGVPDALVDKGVLELGSGGS